MATTTNYSWSTPDNTAYVKDGASAIRTLGSSVDTTLYTALGGAYPGLRLIKKQTIGTAVTSVTVTDAFSATYDNYKIIISGAAGSVSDSISFRVGSASTNYRYAFVYNSYNTTTASTGSSSASEIAYAGGMNSGYVDFNVDVRNPFLVKPTNIGPTSTITGTYAGTCNGWQTDSTSHTAFTIIPASGNITGGTIYVYGYGTS
jgi:hypothetical protein